VNAIPSVFPTDPQTFQSDVIERSNELPVIVLFWAEQMPETLAARDFLDTQVNARSGKVLLALVDVAADQSLAQHLQVQTLPRIRVVKDGQLVELLETKDFDGALAVLKRAIEEEPGNAAFRVELADVLILVGQLTEGKSVLAGIGEDVPDVARPRARLSFVEEAADLGSLESLEKQYAEKPEDLEVQYSLAVCYAADNRIEEALESALDILCTDRKFRDDLGRLTMLRIFDLLPQGDALATSFRRRMFNFMH